MRFHWMERGGKTSVDHLKTTSNIVDEFGYESMLLVYHSQLDDPWIKAARALDTNHKFKYMPAIRTYAISPEYCAMMCKSFYEISPNRLMLNIVSGDLHASETSVRDSVFIKDLIDTPEKRLKYTDEWIKKFLDLAGNTVSGIVMGGHSNETKLMVEKYNGTHLSMLNMHKNAYTNSNFLKNKKQMVSFSVIINDSEEEVKRMTDASMGSNQWTLSGNKDSVKKQILDLKNIGVTDLMMHANPEDKNVSLIHYLMKEIMEEQNGI